MKFGNLPVQLTSFIGRERELADVERLVSTSRLVKLTGAGGCGKTRLVIQLANNISVTSADDVWLVELVSPEEHYLEVRFGKDYPLNRRAVPRWIDRFQPV
jgi:KaiC/GvpD/RAD55 family RecA-like ATPase